VRATFEFHVQRGNAGAEEGKRRKNQNNQTIIPNENSIKYTVVVGHDLGFN